MIRILDIFLLALLSMAVWIAILMVIYGTVIFVEAIMRLL